MAFNAKLLGLVRKRKRLTKKALADLAGLSAMTITRIENEQNIPDDATVNRLANALKYPAKFFYEQDPDELDTSAVSFRSLSKMSTKERDAALAAGSIGLRISDWLETQFDLPNANLVDLSYETSPEAAAGALRAHWGIGERPIGNMLGLLEVNGIRVFSLSEANKSVDAFSFWRDDRPFIFLNTYKTAEHSVFDSGHELGHLILHKHAGTQKSRLIEREANQFSSAFLMPENDVRSRMPKFITVDLIIKAKSRWRVSALALTHRLHMLELLTDWQYKSACIELARRGYRTGEPVGIQRESSAVWKKVLANLWKEKKTKKEIAAELNLPTDELEGLIWGLAGPVSTGDTRTNPTPLRVV